MPSFVVDDDAVREFVDRDALEEWYVRNHATAAELWLKLHKKGSGLPSVTNAESLDVALCWGWIDGIRKPFDGTSFLQRYTPRTRNSRWSTRNQAHVHRLTAEGRMRPPGQAQIDLAKAEGRLARHTTGQPRWSFRPISCGRSKRGRTRSLRSGPSTLGTVTRSPIALHLMTDAARARKIEAFVEMFARGESIHPRS